MKPDLIRGVAFDSSGFIRGGGLLLWFQISATLNYFVFQSFDFENTCTWWSLFQKRVVHTKFDIYVFIIHNKYQNFNKFQPTDSEL
jgi:hypothetical protein